MCDECVACVRLVEVTSFNHKSSRCNVNVFDREQELPKKLGAVAAILALVDTVSMQDEKIKIDLALQLNRTLENSSNEGLLREV